MVTQGVIMAVLIGIVITGVIPFIGGIVLLLMGKIKGSSFWAGVLALLIAMIVTAIFGAVMAVPLMDMMQNNPVMFSAISVVITSLCVAIAMGICEGACMKTNTFKGAISCGAGFGITYSITTAIGLISIYVTSGMINSGQFDSMYSAAIDMGAVTKEDLYEMKSQFIELTLSDIILQIAIAVAFSAALVACSIFIMYGKCSKNLALGIISSVIIIALDGLAGMIPNVIAASVVSLAIAAAAVFFAVRMKDKVVQEQKPAIQDSFLQSVENSRNDNSQE